MKKSFLLSGLVAALILVLPAAASAVVPAFSLSEPTNNQKISNNLSLGGYTSNVDVVYNCTIPNLPPYSTYVANCGYTARHLSIGFSVSSQLAEGSHTVTVQAIAQDGSGQSSTINRTVIVDRTAPVVSIGSGPAHGSSVSGDDFSWSFSANEAVTYECQFDDGGWNSCTSPFSVTDIADGSHTFSVRGYDGLHTGSATRTFTVNNAPPQAEFISIDGVAWEGTAIDTAGGFDVEIGKSREDSLLECRIDGGEWNECGGYWPIGGLTDGTHTLEARAYLPGPADVQDPPASATVNVDATAPVADFSAVQLHQAGTTAQFPWSANESISYSECQIDDGPWSEPCPTEFFDLAPGEHVVELWLVDEVGNAAPSDFVFYTYTSAPDTIVTPAQAAATAVDKAVFYLSSEKFSTFECRVDGGAWKSCNSPTAVLAGEYAAGSHVFETRATNPVGLTDPTPASTAFTLTAPPSIAAPKVSKLTAKGKAVSLTATGAGTFGLRVDSCTKKKKKRKLVCKKFASVTANATGAGKVAFKLKKKLKKGAKYRLTVTATSPTGDTKKTVRTIKAK